jgi:hypothetical protein
MHRRQKLLLVRKNGAARLHQKAVVEGVIRTGPVPNFYFP